MGRILIVVTSLLLSTAVFGQSYDWAKKFETGSYSLVRNVLTTNAGNIFILGGYTNSGNSTAPGGIFIKKLDSNGNEIWSQNIVVKSGATLNESIYNDEEENSFITITFNGTLSFAGTDYSSNSFDFLFLKLNQSGVAQFIKVVGASNHEESTSLTGDAADNIYILGRANGDIVIENLILSGPAGTFEYFLAKYSRNGALIWAKRFATGGSVYNGKLAHTVDKSRIIVFGQFLQSVNIGGFNLSSQGSDDLFLAEISLDGNFNWVKGIGGNEQEWFRNGLVTQSGIYLNGSFNNTIDLGNHTVTANTSDDNFVAKFNLQGESMWGKPFNASKMVAANAFEEVITIYNDKITKYDSSLSTVQWQKVSNNANYYTAQVNGTEVVGAGFFSGTATFDSISLSTSSQFQSFVMKLFGSTPTKVLEPEQGKLIIYPNPTRSEINLFINQQWASGFISVKDISGNLILRQKVSFSGKSIISINLDVSAGIYLIEYQSGKDYFREKVIIEK